MPNNTHCKYTSYKGRDLVLRDPYMWVHVVVVVYITIVSLLVMYGLKKTTRKFQTGQLLVFLISTTDLAIGFCIVFEQYILPFILQSINDENWCRGIRKIFLMLEYVVESFELVLIALLVVCRYISIRYPFRNDKLSRFTTSKSFVAMSLILHGTCYTVFRITAEYYKTIQDATVIVLFSITNGYFLIMATLNIRLIIKLTAQRDNNNNVGTQKCRKRQQKAIITITIMMVSTIATTAPLIIIQFITINIYMEKDIHKMKVMLANHSIWWCYTLWVFGVGLNSNIYLCRSVKIMRTVRTMCCPIHDQSSRRMINQTVTE